MSKKPIKDLPTTEEVKNPVNFKYPDVFEPDSKVTHKYNINRKKSEICVLLEALGTPKVFYAGKQNKYFKDAEFKNEFKDEEILKLNLKIPAEIENDRRRLQKQVLEGNLDMSYEEIISRTCPKEIESPEHIKARLANIDPMQRMINRVNKSTLGK